MYSLQYTVDSFETLVGGFNPSEKYEFVGWDDDIPNWMEVTKIMFQTTNQILYYVISTIIIIIIIHY